jgi:hypothetical protein
MRGLVLYGIEECIDSLIRIISNLLGKSMRLPKYYLTDMYRPKEVRTAVNECDYIYDQTEARYTRINRWLN